MLGKEPGLPSRSYKWQRRNESIYRSNIKRIKKSIPQTLEVFSTSKYSNDTELSKYVWKLKTENRRFDITRSIIKKVPAYKVGSRRCDQCLEEKLQLMKGRKKNLLNKRSELFSKCQHVTKHLLSQWHICRIFNLNCQLPDDLLTAWNSE